MRSVTRVLFSLCISSGGFEVDRIHELVEIVNDALVGGPVENASAVAVGCRRKRVTAAQPSEARRSARTVSEGRGRRSSLRAAGDGGASAGLSRRGPWRGASKDRNEGMRRCTAWEAARVSAYISDVVKVFCAAMWLKRTSACISASCRG